MGLNENRLAKHAADLAAKKETMMNMINRRVFGRAKSYEGKTPVSERDHAAVLKAEQKRQRKRTLRRAEGRTS